MMTGCSKSLRGKLDPRVRVRENVIENSERNAYHEHGLEQ
jgi:hypothetical protein